jgi:hypothetical protein
MMAKIIRTGTETGSESRMSIQATTHAADQKAEELRAMPAAPAALWSEFLRRNLLLASLAGAAALRAERAGEARPTGAGAAGLG